MIAFVFSSNIMRYYGIRILVNMFSINQNIQKSNIYNRNESDKNMLQNILYLWYMGKSKIKSTLQVLSLLILQATVHTASRQTMMCSADESQLIRLLMQLLKAKKVIEIGKIHKCMSLCFVQRLLKGIHQILYLFIYKLRQDAWISHRASSTTWSRKKNLI